MLVQFVSLVHYLQLLLVGSKIYESRATEQLKKAEYTLVRTPWKACAIRNEFQPIRATTDNSTLYYQFLHESN